MPAQERISKLSAGGAGEPGTLLVVNDAAMGMIKIVSGSGSPDQIEDRVPVRAGSQARKTCQVSLLSWELNRRIHGSSEGLEKRNTASTE